MNRKELIAKLKARSLDSPMGSLVEDYSDLYGVDDELVENIKRFIASANPMNRDAVLSVLSGIDAGRGYEADALLLHAEGLRRSDNTDITGAHWLQRMAKLGNSVAQRIVFLLALDDIWAEDYLERSEPL